MSKRSVGLLLGTTLIIALATLVQDFRFDQLIARERAAAASIDRDLASLSQSLSDLHAVQAGYVGVGQAPGSWKTRATELFDRMEGAIAARKALAPNADAIWRYDAALQHLEALRSIDGRAREAVDLGDRLSASNLIFIDGAEPRDKAAAEIAALRAIEEQASTARSGRLATLRLAMNGIALLLIVLVTLYFGRALTILAQRPPASTAQMLRDLPPPVKTGTTLSLSSAAAAPVPASSSAASAVVAPPPAPRVPSAPLAATAELCVDLARVLDGRDVPALLERAAALLEAKGIMLWSVDTGGALLRPSLCHGYSDKVLRKLRPLQVDGDNVTAIAFRSMQAQVLPGASSSDSAAIAVPLITATGCVGVLAAEIRQSKPNADVLPLARILASQFALLVAPSDESAARTAQG